MVVMYVHVWERERERKKEREREYEYIILAGILGFVTEASWNRNKNPQRKEI